MALDPTQKAQIRMYLGRQGGYDFDSELESRLDSVTDQEELLVEGLLARLVALETAEDSALSGGAGLYERVEDVYFRKDSATGFEGLQARGRSLVNRLSALLGVPINVDYFGDGISAACVIPLG